MVVILKQIFPLVLSALILVASLQATGAAARGVRGGQQEQLDSLAVSGDSDIDSVERELKKKDKKKDKMKKAKKKSGKFMPYINDVFNNGATLSSRLDLPTAPTPAPVPFGMAAWEIECGNVGACAGSFAQKCKTCLYALSFNSEAQINANGGIKACARNQCGSCGAEDISGFFECGYYVKNPSLKPVDTSTMPGASIRTPPPMANATDASFQTPVINGTIVDTVNCPAVYPGNNTNCTGFKDCRYYEVGPDHKCECSATRTIWNCTGTIRNTEYLNVAKVPETTNEVESEDFIKPLPSSQIVASRIEVVASAAGGL